MVVLIAMALYVIGIGRFWIIAWAAYASHTLLYVLYRRFHQEIEYPLYGAESKMLPSEMRYVEFVLDRLGTRRGSFWLALQCITDIYDPKSAQMLIYQCRRKIMARRNRRTRSHRGQVRGD